MIRKYWKQFTVFMSVLVLSILMGVGGVSAYMMDRDDSLNTVSIGDVQITAWEPNFPTEDEDGDTVPDECELVIPYETIPKDPRIKNIGTNKAIVFFRITAPMETLSLISDDGVRGAEALQDLFWFKEAADSDDKHENNFNDNWIEITQFSREEVICDAVNDEGNGLTYVFGYHTILDTGEETSTLFDKVQNKKYGSRTIGPEEIEQIRIDSFAIQADDIHQAGIEFPTNGETLTEEQLTYIYSVFINQNQEALSVLGKEVDNS